MTKASFSLSLVRSTNDGCSSALAGDVPLPLPAERTKRCGRDIVSTSERFGSTCYVTLRDTRRRALPPFDSICFMPLQSPNGANLLLRTLSTPIVLALCE